MIISVIPIIKEIKKTLYDSLNKTGIKAKKELSKKNDRNALIFKNGSDEIKIKEPMTMIQLDFDSIKKNIIVIKIKERNR